MAESHFKTEFGAQEATAEEETTEKVLERKYVIERRLREIDQMTIKNLVNMVNDLKNHVARLERKTEQYQNIIDANHLQSAGQTKPQKTPGFASEINQENESIDSVKEIYEQISNINKEICERQKESAEYRDWLWRTKAADVSFDDWKAGRYVIVSDTR